MGIFSIEREWVFGAQATTNARDALLDWYITDALIEETRAPVPPGAWTRLKSTITERKFVRGYGMWVLDQTPHDPPECTPADLSEAQLAQALYLHSRPFGERRWLVGHPTLGGLSPTFITVFTL